MSKDLREVNIIKLRNKMLNGFSYISRVEEVNSRDQKVRHDKRMLTSYHKDRKKLTENYHERVENFVKKVVYSYK